MAAMQLFCEGAFRPMIKDRSGSSNTREEAIHILLASELRRPSKMVQVVPDCYRLAIYSLLHSGIG